MPLKYKDNRYHKNPSHKRTYLIIIAIVAATAGLLTTLELTGVINVFHKKYPGLATQPTTPNRTAGTATKGATPPPTSTPSSDGQSTSNDASSSKTPTDNNATLTAPYGTFVSNHHPNLSGKPSPNEIQSTCNTTSGATCTIVFTNGSVTKQLPVQNTDLQGAAYWTWKLQDIGLTAGTWKVQAKAVLGNQTKAVDDALTLEVKQ